MFDKIFKNKEIIYIFIASRIIFFLFMYASNNNLQELYNLFDGKHYLSIAQNGYWEIRLTAFFPLIPLIIKCFGKIGLFIINNICFLMSLFIINEIKKDDKNNKLTLLFFAFSPMAFFLCCFTQKVFFYF